MTTDVPTDFDKAHQFLRRAFALACRRHKLDAMEARTLARALEVEAANLPTPTIPASAPELWTARDPNLKENPVAFVRRVYAAWLGSGLARGNLKHLDPELYRALAVWEHRHPKDRINELPTKTELLDRQIAALGAVLSQDELISLATTLQTRQRRLKL